MRAALDKLLEQKDQTCEDGMADKSLAARLAARIDSSGLHTDESGAGPVGDSGASSGADKSARLG
jgi:hypothetical protein